MFTDLNFLQTTVDRDMLDLDTSFVAELVGEVFDDLQQAKKEADAMFLRKVSKISRLSMNPFDKDMEAKYAATEMVIDPSSKRFGKSRNPFDDDYSSDDESSDGNAGEDGKKAAPDGSAAATDSSDSSAPPSEAKRVSLPPPTASSSSASSRSCPCCFESVTQSRHARVHTGFYQAYLSIRLEVFRALVGAMVHCISRSRQEEEDVFEDVQAGSRLQRPLKIHICGHSLGTLLICIFITIDSFNIINVINVINTFQV
jgi:hypothetical protein